MLALRRWVPICLAAVLCQSGCAYVSLPREPAYTPQPIPTAKGGYTEADWKKAYTGYQTRTLDQAYERFSKHDPAWDDAARSYVKTWRETYTGEGKWMSYADLRLGGKALIDSGCDDPLALYLTGITLQESYQLSEAASLLRRAVDGFRNSQHPRARAAYAAAHLAAVLNSMGSPEKKEAREIARLAIQWVVESCRDASYLDGEQRLMLWSVEDVGEIMWLEARERLYDALKASPDVHPYVTAVTGGRLHVDKAWEARGSGWASTVTEEGWQGFHDNLAVARQLLTDAWEAYPDYPEAPSKMLVLARAGEAGSGETGRLWFDRAVAAQMDYWPAYDAYVTLLLPRWQGSHEQIYDFGVECLATKRFDTIVPFQFFDCVQTISEDIGGYHALWSDPETWSRLETMFEGYEKTAEGRDLIGYQSTRAAVAWRAGHFAEARVLMDALGENIDPLPFRQNFSVEFSVVKDEVFALTGPNGPSLIEANSLYESGKVSEAAAIYGRAWSATDPNAVGATYIRNRLAMAGMEAAFAAGDWVPLIPESSFAGWTIRSGRWRVEKDDSLTGIAEEYLRIRCNADLGNRLEFAADVEFVASDGKWPSIGVCLRFPEYRLYDEVTFYACKRRQQVTVTRSDVDEEAVTAPAAVEDTNALRITVFDETVNVYLNGDHVIRDAQVDMHHPEAAKQLELGTYYVGSGNSLRFSNMKVRRLTKPPKAESETPKRGSSQQEG